jgi:hypothetical protein
MACDKKQAGANADAHALIDVVCQQWARHDGSGVCDQQRLKKCSDQNLLSPVMQLRINQSSGSF